MLLRPCIRYMSTRLPMAGEHKPLWKILKQEFDGRKTTGVDFLDVPRECDIVIIGGGLIGSSVAYWLKQKSPKGFSVAVVERDPMYTRASSVLSVGGVRHQFSVPESVQMSMFTTEFLRNIKEHLSVLDSEPPEVMFNHHGYLFLSEEKNAGILENCVKQQRALGAQIDLMSKERLAKKFPWLNLEDIAVGSYGLEGEGWFDPWSLLRALKQKNISLGVEYIKGDVVGFTDAVAQYYVGDEVHESKILKAVEVKNHQGDIQPIKMAMCINCAGAWAGEIAKMAGIGEGEGELATPLPVEPRKRFVYFVHCPNGPGIEMPLMIDPTGVYSRREGFGGHYLIGGSPSEEDEPDIKDLEVDYDFFNNHLWPIIARRVPKFEELKLKSAWAGYYDYNYVDQNLIIGNHPYHRNMFFANGLSGHGIQHAIPIGRALMEYILEDDFQTIDLSRFCFDRFAANEPIFESAIV